MNDLKGGGLLVDLCPLMVNSVRRCQTKNEDITHTHHDKNLKKTFYRMEKKFETTKNSFFFFTFATQTHKSVCWQNTNLYSFKVYQITSALSTYFLKMGRPRPLFVYFRFFQAIYGIKDVDFSGIELGSTE